MKLDTTKWKWFQLGGDDGLFDIRKGKRLTSEDQTEGNTPYIGAIDSNNGVSNYIGQEPIHEGNTISLSYNGSVGEAFYQPTPYWATDDVNALYLRPEHGTLSPATGLFVCAVLKHDKYRYSYGRKWTLDNMTATKVKLPTTSDGKPDWQWMESYIDSLHSKPLTTKNDTNVVLFDSTGWKEFEVQELFDVVYGVNLELVNCIETDKNDPEAVAFVSRTESNNGVSAYVKPVPGVEPQPKDTITVAGGGSVLATFLQTQPFYSGRDLYLLYPKESISNRVKLFIATVIKANKYRYNYGRQANVTLPYLQLRLPATTDGKPDWQWMENYIKSLPYGDRL